MALLLQSNIHLDRRMIRLIYLVIVMLGVFSVSQFIEGELGNAPTFSIMRAVLTAVNYSLISLILPTVILILFRVRPLLLYIPAMLNILLCIISLPTGIVFTFDRSDNAFDRGPLGYLPYFVAAFYLALLFLLLVRRYGKTVHEDTSVVIFMVITCIACFVLPLYFWKGLQDWFSTTIAIDVFIYYVFILHQMTKRDALTGLLNRQSYNAEALKYQDSITALIALDMNGLKAVNDKDGHIAGDKALSALADAFLRSANRSQRVYRIGGDEFAIFCIRNSEEEVHALIERLRSAIAETGYSCSVGWCYTPTPRSLDTIYKEADAMLYEDKMRYYEETGKQRRLI